jgi:hypothetical protein
MDSAAFQEIIALARGTAAELAAAEKKVSAFKDELAQLDRQDASPAMSRSITINTKASGWIPEGKPSKTVSARPPKEKT